jgi:hypothetical protein
MSSPGSITAWIDQLRAGDRAAAQPLWEGYFRRLVGLASRNLRCRLPTAMAGAEDVALSAFDSFCRGAEQGRLPLLGDRDDLWRLLFVITDRKAIDLIKHEKGIGRGGAPISPAESRRPITPHKSPRNSSAYSTCWATRRSAWSPWRRWKATRTKKSQTGGEFPRRRLNAS